MLLPPHLHKLSQVRSVRNICYFLLFTLAGLYTMDLGGALLFGLVMIVTLNVWRMRRERVIAEQVERELAEHSVSKYPES